MYQAFQKILLGLGMNLRVIKYFVDPKEWTDILTWLPNNCEWSLSRSLPKRPRPIWCKTPTIPIGYLFLYHSVKYYTTFSSVICHSCCRYLGPTCAQSVCTTNPCHFGGTCAPYPGSGFICLCPFGKHGLFCQKGSLTLLIFTVLSSKVRCNC